MNTPNDRVRTVLVLMTKCDPGIVPMTKCDPEIAPMME
jgi:hypothetical protein